MLNREQFDQVQKSGSAQISATARHIFGLQLPREGGDAMAWMLLTFPGMRTSPRFSAGTAFLILLLGVAGAASCGSVTALAPDGGAAGTGGAAGHTTTGTAGAQGGTNGSAGATQDGGADAAGGSTNVDASVEFDGGADTCFQAVGCRGGTCWEALDGATACVNPVPTPTLTTCQTGGTTCCLKDADCTQSTNGRCLPLLDVEENFCGGAIPLGNVCRYDQCRTDADCTAEAPAGATVSSCVPSGAFGLYNATCIYGGCRTNADCGLHPGGSCQYGQAATNGVCSLRNVLFCAYPSDSCQVTNNATTGCPAGKICVPKSSYQGRECGAPPPEYP
jgi:hypothetical protein